MIESLIAENFRSFGERTRIPISPLTLIVGENSAGKSSLLALARIASTIISWREHPDFNEPPFLFGSFDDIAHYDAATGRAAKQFTVGAGLRIRQTSLGPLAVDVTATFRRHAGQPRLCRIEIVTEKPKLQIQLSEDKGDDDLNPEQWIQPVVEIQLEAKKKVRLADSDMQVDGLSLSILPFLLSRISPQRRNKSAASREVIDLASQVTRAIHRSYRPRSRPVALSPIRTRPVRTYDSLQRKPEPDGSHVPQHLAALAARAPHDWKLARKALSNFGKASGLFDSLKIRHLGSRSRKESSPFQIKLKMSGSKCNPNLVDVGYGVSQALPLLVELSVATRSDIILVQQPEVHLHPRAQAELGSLLFSETTAQRRLLIETHSDHLIDRIRIELKRGKNRRRSKMIQILFLERVAGSTAVHQIKLSSDGRVIEPPSTYRSFFLREDLELLGL